MKSTGRPVLFIAFAPRELNSQALSDTLEALNSSQVTLNIDGQRMAVYEEVQWKTTTNGVITSLPLSLRALQAFRTGKVLDLDVNVANVYREYNPSLEFPLHELGRFLPAVLK